MARRLLIATAALILLALAACGSQDDSPTPATGAASPPSASASPSTAASAPGSDPADPESTSVFDLEVGDCFSADADELEAVAVVDCDASHEYEVFDVFDHEAGADAEYPGDDELVSYADTACQPAFEEFVGIAYGESVYFITSITPSAETWALGDREVVCALNQPDADGEPTSVSGSAEGSGE